MCSRSLEEPDSELLLCKLWPKRFVYGLINAYVALVPPGGELSELAGFLPLAMNCTSFASKNSSKINILILLMEWKKRSKKKTVVM